MHHPTLSSDTSDGGIEIRPTVAAVRIYDVPVFVCWMCVCWRGEHIREEQKERRHRENLGKYIFLITASEVNAAYLGVPTAAAAGGGVI